MSEFWKRTLSGAVYVGIVIGSILYHEALFLSLSICLAFLAVREYNALTHPRCGMDLFAELSAVFCIFPCTIALLYPQPCSPWILLTLLLPIAVLIAELWNKAETPYRTGDISS